MIASRRREDDADDLALVFGDPPPPSLDAVKERDDFGRILPQMNPAVSRRERQAVRAARRSRRTSRSSGTKDIEAEEGYSTDSSLSPSDAADYNTATNKIVVNGKGVLADVHAVAFKDPSQGLGKWFSEWRNQYRYTYISAWGGMGLVSAWEFWVRLEMLGWNPLEVIRDSS
jgi:GC-rich sequence DNA-binding factor